MSWVGHEEAQTLVALANVLGIEVTKTPKSNGKFYLDLEDGNFSRRLALVDEIEEQAFISKLM